MLMELLLVMMVKVPSVKTAVAAEAMLPILEYLEPQRDDPFLASGAGSPSIEQAAFLSPFHNRETQFAGHQVACPEGPERTFLLESSA